MNPSTLAWLPERSSPPTAGGFASPPTPPAEWAQRGTNRLLAALPEDEFMRWLPGLERVNLVRGQTLYESGRQQTHAYFPTTGIVALLKTTITGHTGHTALIGDEGMVGIALFMGGLSTTGQAVVVCPGKGFRLRAPTLLRAFEQCGSVTRLLLRYTLALIAQKSQLAACSKHHCIERRLSTVLLQMLDRLHSNEILVTQEELSKLLGVRRESVSEASNMLEALGLTHSTRGLITVFDRPGLQRRACECYEVVRRESERLQSKSAVA